MLLYSESGYDSFYITTVLWCTSDYESGRKHNKWSLQKCRQKHHQSPTVQFEPSSHLPPYSESSVTNTPCLNPHACMGLGNNVFSFSFNAYLILSPPRMVPVAFIVQEVVDRQSLLLEVKEVFLASRLAEATAKCNTG